MDENLLVGKIFDLDTRSYTQISNAFIDKTDKTILSNVYTKWLWVLLKRYAGINGKIMPSKDTLAKKLICGPTTIFKSTNELIEKGYLIKFYRYSAQTRFKDSQLSNGYVLLKLNDETGLPEKILNSELNSLITQVNSMEKDVDWVIDKVFNDKYVIF